MAGRKKGRRKMKRRKVERMKMEGRNAEKISLHLLTEEALKYSAQPHSALEQ